MIPVGEAVEQDIVFGRSAERVWLDRDPFDVEVDVLAVDLGGWAEPFDDVELVFELPVLGRPRRVVPRRIQVVVPGVRRVVDGSSAGIAMPRPQ